jgi:hypothetical protein
MLLLLLLLLEDIRLLLENIFEFCIFKLKFARKHFMMMMMIIIIIIRCTTAL